MSLMRKIAKNQEGQTLIILLLVMVVALAIGLSVATRSITDLRISTQTEQSSRAFSAAEAGIEEALRDLSQIAGEAEVSPGATYKYTVTTQGVNSYETQTAVKKDDTIELKLNGATATTFDLYWALKGSDDCDSVSGNPASPVLTIISGASAPYSVARTAYSIKSRGDGFTDVTRADNAFNGKTYCAKVTGIVLPASSQLARIKMYYNTASAAIGPQSGTLPPQSYAIRSEGEVSGVKRTIEVTRSLPALPAIFDYVLFSGTGITK